MVNHHEEILNVQNLHKNLKSELETMISDCTECGNCVTHCTYLQQFGTPSKLAKQFQAGTLDVDTIYSCSLCKLCDVFCPEGLTPSYLFWVMRCQMVEEGRAPLKEHRRVLAYEKWGLSRLFQLSAIPENGTSVFFPGCALAGSRPQHMLKICSLLKETIADLGIVLNCCTKPSHDLGRASFFQNSFGALVGGLKEHGITSIITACPSCHQIFRQYGSDFKIKTVYEVLEDNPNLPRVQHSESVCIHDPCATRYETEVQQSVRKLVTQMGLNITDMKHQKKRTLCCGEGGSASFIAPDITTQWAEKRKTQADGNPVVSYCAGCVHFFSHRFPTYHVIDLLLEPEKTLAGKVKISKSPLTYLNRLVLKRKLKKQ